MAPGLQTTLSYGQDRADSLLATDKFSPGLLFTSGKEFSITYDGSFFRHLLPGDRGFGRLENATATLSLPRQTFGVLYHDEWHWDSAGNGAGLYQGGLSYNQLPLALAEKVSYMEKLKSPVNGSGLYDTGYSVRWEQSINHLLRPDWRLSGTSLFDRSSSLPGYAGPQTTTLLVDLISDVTPQASGFSSRQHYRTNTEMASSSVQVPIYAGKGMGTYIYDSTRQEYVPHVPGDYFMQQQQVYDQASAERIRNTAADITWNYSPRRHWTGIMTDLAWQGALSCEEHVDAAYCDLASWVPGYRSVASYFGPAELADPVQYANCSYRQEVTWTPRRDSLHAASDRPTVRLALTPDYQNMRGYREAGIETRLEFERPVRRLTFGAAADLIGADHRDTTPGNSYSFYDRRLELTQKCGLFRGASATLLEVAGVGRETPEGVTQAAWSLDSVSHHLYCQLAPSVSWQPTAKGSVGAMYTLSKVPPDGAADFRMARGFSSGVSHQITVTADVKVGSRFLINGSFRGDIRKQPGKSDFEPANNVLSLQMRVFM